MAVASGVFIGLAGVYAADIPGDDRDRPARDRPSRDGRPAMGRPAIGRPAIGRPAERAVGFFRLGAGPWLIYLVFSTWCSRWG